MQNTAQAVAAATAPRFIKLSATGLLLPRSAKDWDGVYIPNARDPQTGEIVGLTVARRILPIRGDFKLANKACAEQDLCGAKAVRSIGMREFVNYLLEDDRTGPCLDPEFFTIDDPWQWIWTSTECAPRGDAFGVGLGSGSVDRGHQSYHGSALACRPGQLPGISEYLAQLSSGEAA